MKTTIKSLMMISMGTLILFSCQKHDATKDENSRQTIASGDPASASNSGSMKWGKNDDLYKAQMKEIGKKLKSSLAARIDPNPDPDPDPTPQPSYSCSASGGVVYGYYDDPENLVVEGPYEAASSSGQEAFLQTCSLVTDAISSSRTYLLNEGYSDIVSQLDLSGESYKLIHAANALSDLKEQVNGSSGGGYQQARIVNCILQAIGYSAIAELGANWASASRQVILRAVGKLASRYLGFFGAAIAVVSFVDCMWG